VNLNGNSYGSTIPTVFGTMSDLQYFYAVNGDFTGDLSFVKQGGLSRIKYLWVDHNKLHGTLPTALGSLTTLQSLSVTRNSLTGSLPAQLSHLTNMVEMWFYTNKLSGTFPNGYTALKKLVTFHAEGNSGISGSVKTLCSALESPFGALESLGADCESGGKVTCPSTCKICCCSLTACSD
jgi:Leucine-rich repeat (LRR) protein